MDIGVYSWSDPASGAFLDAPPASLGPRDCDVGNVVANNTVVRVGIEFRGSAGIAAGCVRHAGIPLPFLAMLGI